MKKIILLLLLLLTVLPLKAQFVRNEGASIQINTGTYVRSGEWTNATATSTTALSGELLLTQDLVNNGTFAGANGSWLRFVGGALQNVEGTNQIALSNLQVNNGGNHLQLQNQVLINTQLDLTNGHLFSDLATIFFSPTALNPAETNANRIIGTAVMQARPIGVGAMPTFLNATLGAGADVGNVTLTRRTGTQGIINIAGNTSIASYWTFETTAGGTRDLTLSWLSDLDNGKDLTQLQRWRTASYNTIAAPWEFRSDLANLSARTHTLAEAALQNSWTYSDAANPLGLIRCVDNQTANTVALACTYTHSDNTWNSTVSAIVTGLTYDLTGATTASGLTTLNGAVFNLGVTTVTATAVSPTLSQSCSFTVTVSDNVNPTITAPAAVNVNADATLCTASGVALGTPTTADNCSVASVTNNAPATFPLGNTTVTWTVTDGSGNIATATQVVTVTDSQNPTITAPAAVNVNADAGLCTASGVALGTPTTADNCSVASVTNNAPAIFPLGATTVTWTVTDGSGNTATDTQIVTVTDNQNPTITAPAAVSVNTDA
ncbi:HYR domain-containing protein, partial [Hugenholtzia roseola]|uniref:HYR domain-containing protein n=1 Tax=Hugenholtzia roseola TaxID=1002 RepID=UPI0005541338